MDIPRPPFRGPYLDFDILALGEEAAAGDAPDHILEFRILGPFEIADEGRRLVEDFWAERLQKGAVLAMALTRAAEAAVLAGEPRRAAGILVELLGVLADRGTRRWVPTHWRPPLSLWKSKRTARRDRLAAPWVSSVSRSMGPRGRVLPVRRP